VSNKLEQLKTMTLSWADTAISMPIAPGEPKIGHHHRHFCSKTVESCRLPADGDKAFRGQNGRLAQSSRAGFGLANLNIPGGIGWRRNFLR